MGTEDTHPSMDLVRDILTELRAMRAESVAWHAETTGRLEKLEGHATETTARLDKLDRGQSEQGAYVGAIRHDHEVLKSRVSVLERQLLDAEEELRRIKRESSHGDHVQGQALEAAMVIAAKRDDAAKERDARLEALITETRDMHAVVIQALHAVATSPRWKRMLRLGTYAAVVGGFLSGAFADALALATSKLRALFHL